MEEPAVKKKHSDVSDAVHPRFLVKPDAEEEHKFQVENDYYCIHCHLFFSPTPEGLKIHFDGVVTDHQPFGKCFYCNGNVYEYRFKNNREFFHSCPTTK